MKNPSRRSVLKALSGMGAFTLIGCGNTLSALSDAGATADGGSGGSDGGSTGSSDAGALATDGSVDAASFATGSGAFLSGKDYGNPFSGAIGPTCIAYAEATKGPCHSNTYQRKDVSDGLVGLPTRFELLVVDTACAPVPNAIVEVWYASPAGTYSKAAQAIDEGTGYSGSLSDLNTAFCTGNDATALASNWLRGYQTSGNDGRVTIDGIYPGWYSGRTTHVHFIVTSNGKTSSTSQMLFDETLNTKVYTQHPSYKARGDKNTTNANDMVARGLNLSTSTMSIAQQSDGALVAWLAIAIA